MGLRLKATAGPRGRWPRWAPGVWRANAFKASFVAASLLVLALYGTALPPAGRRRLHGGGGRKRCVARAAVGAGTGPEIAKAFREGEAEARKRRVVVAGIARNQAKTIERMLELMRDTGARFSDYRIVIYENDSTDGTAELLRSLCRAPREVCITEKREDPEAMAHGSSSGGRFAALAKYRNILLEYVTGNFADWDFVIFADTDLLEMGWQPPFSKDCTRRRCAVRNGLLLPRGKLGWLAESVPTSLATPHWDVMCANGIFNGGFTYDTLALRTDDVTASLKDDVPLRHALMQSVKFSGIAPVPVRSCFGGLAIYRMAILKGCAYTGDDCEHVGLHSCIADKNRGSVAVNPLMHVSYDRTNAEACYSV